jgi:hypothetical protein
VWLLILLWLSVLILVRRDRLRISRPSSGGFGVIISCLSPGESVAAAHFHAAQANRRNLKAVRPRVHFCIRRPPHPQFGVNMSELEQHFYGAPFVYGSK